MSSLLAVFPSPRLHTATPKRWPACFRDHRSTEWIGLERTFKAHLVKSPCSEQGHLQVAQSIRIDSMPTPPKAVCTGVYKPPALLIPLALWARKSLWDLVVIAARRGKWWHWGGMQLSARVVSTLPAALLRHTRSPRAASASSSPKLPLSLYSSFCLAPQAHWQVCSLFVWGAAAGIWGEGWGCCSCCLHGGGEQLFLVLSFPDVQQTHIHSQKQLPWWIFAQIIMLSSS